MIQEGVRSLKQSAGRHQRADVFLPDCCLFSLEQFLCNTVQRQIVRVSIFWGLEPSKSPSMRSLVASSLRPYFSFLRYVGACSLSIIAALQPHLLLISFIFANHTCCRAARLVSVSNEFVEFRLQHRCSFTLFFSSRHPEDPTKTLTS